MSYQREYCKRCSIKLYEFDLANGQRKIFRSFATLPNGDQVCLNCYKGMNKEEDDGYKTKSSTDDDIL